MALRNPELYAQLYAKAVSRAIARSLTKQYQIFTLWNENRNPSHMAKQSFAERARQYLDSKPTSSKLDRQSAETENHGDKETAGDPNAMGPAMRTPYGAVSPRFDDAAQEPDGMGQIGGSRNDGYPYADGAVLGAVDDDSGRGRKGYPPSVASLSDYSETDSDAHEWKDYL